MAAELPGPSQERRQEPTHGPVGRRGRSTRTRTASGLSPNRIRLASSPSAMPTGNADANATVGSAKLCGSAVRTSTHDRSYMNRCSPFKRLPSSCRSFLRCRGGLTGRRCRRRLSRTSPKKTRCGKAVLMRASQAIGVTTGHGGSGGRASALLTDAPASPRAATSPGGGDEVPAPPDRPGASRVPRTPPPPHPTRNRASATHRPAGSDLPPPLQPPHAHWSAVTSRQNVLHVASWFVFRGCPRRFVAPHTGTAPAI